MVKELEINMITDFLEQIKDALSIFYFGYITILKSDKIKKIKRRITLVLIANLFIRNLLMQISLHL